MPRTLIPSFNEGKHYPHTFFPLESNPEVFTEVIHGLGVSPSLSFADVLSMDEPDILAMTPRPALSLVLLYDSSGSDGIKAAKRESESKRVEYIGKGEGEDVVWYRQTIHNACGLYGILHAISNGPARHYIRTPDSLLPLLSHKYELTLHLLPEPASLMSRLLEQAIPLAPEERAHVLEGSEELEKAHTAAALKGDTAPPENPGDDVESHYICFVPSEKNGCIYHMDGEKKGPIDTGVTLKEGEDMLSETALQVVKAFIQKGEDETWKFNLLALVEAEN